MRTVLLSLQSLLQDANCASPLNSYAASLWASPEEYRALLLAKKSVNPAMALQNTWMVRKRPQQAHMNGLISGPYLRRSLAIFVRTRNMPT